MNTSTIQRKDTSPEQRVLALEFYRAARAEVVQRLALREQVLLASLTVTGVIAGFALKQTPRSSDTWLLMIIPYFAFPFTIAHVRHGRIMVLIGKYMRRELNPFLELSSDIPTLELVEDVCSGKKKPSDVRHWEHSLTLAKELPWFLRIEAFVHAILLCAPAVTVLIALPFLVGRTGFTNLAAKMIYGIGCISTAMALWLTLNFLISEPGWKLSFKDLKRARFKTKKNH